MGVQLISGQHRLNPQVSEVPGVLTMLHCQPESWHTLAAAVVKAAGLEASSSHYGTLSRPRSSPASCSLVLEMLQEQKACPVSDPRSLPDKQIAVTNCALIQRAVCKEGTLGKKEQSREGAAHPAH